MSDKDIADAPTNGMIRAAERLACDEAKELIRCIYPRVFQADEAPYVPQLGDVVVGIGEYDGRKQDGVEGVVCHARGASGPPGVFWAGPPNTAGGHSCNHHCPDGYGFYVPASCLKLMYRPTPSD